MRTVLVASVALLIGMALGWSLREPAPAVTKYVYRDVHVPTKPVGTSKPEFPSVPKPPVETPKPENGTVAATGPIPAPLGGDLPALPAAGGSIASLPFGPLAPATSPAPVADLKADEALARRIVLTAGGQVVSSADAKDASGKMGRTLVAEIAPGAANRLESSLRRSLGDRVILSDGGTVTGSDADTRKEEDALLALRKQRDQARRDFLPNAPVLVDIEEAVQKQERIVADLRKASGRAHLNILIRPGIGG